MCCAAAAAEGCLLLLTDLRLLCATVEGGRLLWHVPLREARARLVPAPLSASQPVSSTPHSYPTEHTALMRAHAVFGECVAAALQPPRATACLRAPKGVVLHAPRREPHRCEMRLAPCAPPHHTLPCRAPTKVRAVCTDHEHAAEAALLLAMATVDG